MESLLDVRSCLCLLVAFHCHPTADSCAEASITLVLLWLGIFTYCFSFSGFAHLVLLWHLIKQTSQLKYSVMKNLRILFHFDFLSIHGCMALTWRTIAKQWKLTLLPLHKSCLPFTFLSIRMIISHQEKHSTKLILNTQNFLLKKRKKELKHLLSTYYMPAAKDYSSLVVCLQWQVLKFGISHCGPRCSCTYTCGSYTHIPVCTVFIESSQKLLWGMGMRLKKFILTPGSHCQQVARERFEATSFNLKTLLTSYCWRSQAFSLVELSCRALK